MSKRFLVCVVLVLFAVSLTLAAPKGTKGSWSGWITDSACGAKGNSEAHADCAKKCVKEKGAKWALYNEADKKVYILDPQEGVEAHAGHHVKVSGTLGGDTIHNAKISMIAEKKKAEKKEHPSKKG
jgi:hypothetical protein